MLKLKLIAWTAVIMVAGVFMADFFFRHPAINTGARDENEVVLQVTFTPHRRVVDTAYVYIQVFVDGVRVWAESTGRSPWKRTVQVGTGHQIILVAQQAFGMSLGCVLKPANAPPYAQHIDNVGTVKCGHQF